MKNDTYPLAPKASLQVTSKSTSLRVNDAPIELIRVEMCGVEEDAGDLTLHLPEDQADMLRLGCRYQITLTPVDD